MEREGERMFLECLDQLKVAAANLDEVLYCNNSCLLFLLYFFSPLELIVTTSFFTLYRQLFWIHKRYDITHDSHVTIVVSPCWSHNL